MNSHKERKIFIMKKILALVLVFMLSLGTVAFAAEFKDMPDDWSTAALTAAVENGLLGGSGGYIKPSDNMTRAEMATIMARACGATKEAIITGFTDVNPDDWFYASMAKAVAMGAFTGSDNKLNPNNPITRQEFLVLQHLMLTQQFLTSSRMGARLMIGQRRALLQLSQAVMLQVTMATSTPSITFPVPSLLLLWTDLSSTILMMQRKKSPPTAML